MPEGATRDLNGKFKNKNVDIKLNAHDAFLE